jgi:opacity protein-like surface antigen
MAVVAAPFAVQAQSNDSIPGLGIGLIGGATLPVGNYNKIAAAGFHVGGFVDFGRRFGPAGLRADLMYHGFGDKDLLETGDNTTEVTFSNKYSMVSGTLNLVFGLPLEDSPIRPYVLGGVGGYYVKNTPKCNGPDIVCDPFLSESDERGSATKFGINGGGGIEFGMGGANVFLEARYHHIFSAAPQLECEGEVNCNTAAAKLVPISLGVTLRF